MQFLYDRIVSIHSRWRATALFAIYLSLPEGSPFIPFVMSAQFVIMINLIRKRNRVNSSKD